MCKKVIKLPNERIIKYRVTKETPTWILIEAIIDKNTLELLDNFAEKELINKDMVPDLKRSTEKIKPVTYEFTEEQKEKMGKLKKSLNIKDNNELDKFVKEWSYGQMESYKQITPEKLVDFVNFVTTEYLE